jgi:hypothetical protein
MMPSKSVTKTVSSEMIVMRDMIKFLLHSCPVELGVSSLGTSSEQVTHGFPFAYNLALHLPERTKANDTSFVCVCHA